MGLQRCSNEEGEMKSESSPCCVDVVKKQARES